MKSNLELFLSGNQTSANRPLPELIIEHLGGTMMYVDQPDGTRLYRVVDWVYEIKGSSAKERNTAWANLKRVIVKLGDINLDEIVYPLEIETPGGPQTTEFTTDEGLYAITQRMSDRSLVVRQVKDYLAKAGVFVDDLRTEPEQRDELMERLIAENPERAMEAIVARYRAQGKSDLWIERRIVGMQKRNKFTSALRETSASSPNYAQATNAGYQGAFNMMKDEIVAYLGLTKQQARQLRDHISEIALQGIALYETASAEKMKIMKRTLTPLEQAEIVRTCARIVAPSMKALADYVGVDVLSGQPLLTTGE
ncbi:MAG: hypothetical protein BroJett018_15270 [Chloroflexota bacterium]|nr:hypothetical protein [Chloroflexota bacterium]NOG65113.1 hypothetical protein [Chloroflexota bacterium]GIK63733.1 MAG: hypothetical protein BroJett018_15270 [Chloroflexota bacterium]